MIEMLQALLHADPIVLTTLAGLIATLGWSIKKIVEARAKIIEANAKAIPIAAQADADAKTGGVKADLADKEITARFLTLASKDRDQIDSLMADVRRELVRCESDRHDLVTRMDGMQKVMAAQEQRIVELENANHALFKELQTLHNSIAAS